MLVSKVVFFEKKKQKSFDSFGFGFSGWAQPGFARVVWCFFSEANILSSVGTA
jgi:hypothetical protein